MNPSGKAIIISAPSGAGKTTILKRILPVFEELEFSISVTSRSKREGETDGKDYYFLSVDDFRNKISANEFLEWEEVYEGLYYGTLHSEIERIWDEGKAVIFDVDVLGGINIKNALKEKALSIFIMPPSIAVLEERLRGRSTETEEVIKKRIQRAEIELAHSGEFDKIILNDDIDVAVEAVADAINDFTGK